MKLILDDRVQRFKRLFSEEKSSGPEVATQKISPSGLGCEVAVAWKLTGKEMAPENRSFDSNGYASAGNARHQAIQEFLANNPNVEWVNLEKFVSENNLPFTVDYEYGIRENAEKYGLTCDQVCELTGSYERLLRHTNNLIQFKLDGLIKFEGEYYIVEIKTCSEADLAKAPLEKHQLQGKTYALMLGIRNVIWIYEDRTKFRHTIAFQHMEDEDIEFIRKKLNRIVLYKDTPEKLERSSNCKYCRYIDLCKEYFGEDRNGTVF